MLSQFPSVVDGSEGAPWLSRRLAEVNGIEDFSFKDIFEPASKRFRLALSGMINFCRYKESKSSIFTSYKEDMTSYDSERLQLIDKSHKLEQELIHSQEVHSETLQDRYEADRAAQEAQTGVDKFRRHIKIAEGCVKEQEKQLAAVKEKSERLQDQVQQARDKVVYLKDQIVDDPQGLEQEIEELALTVRQERVRLEEKTVEKRARAQRDQALSRLIKELEARAEEVSRLQQVVRDNNMAKARSSKEKQELDLLRQNLDVQNFEVTEQEQRIAQIQKDMQRAAQLHADRLEELEARRKKAMEDQQELQAKAAENQKQWSALQQQRLELETELASAKRNLDAEIVDLTMQHDSLLDSTSSYQQGMAELLTQYGGDFSASSRAPSPEAACVVPGAQARRVLACSPSPARGIAGMMRGYVSPARLQMH